MPHARSSTTAWGDNRSDRTAARRQPTFNLNATGAVPIKQPTGTTCGSIAGNGPLLGSYSGMVYDATLGSWLGFGGGGSAFGNGYLQNFCPPEIMVQLCAEMGAHPWFVLPGLSADPLTDFASQLASYIQSNGPAWMIPRFEGPNELWNSGSAGFQQTLYASHKSFVYGWGSTFHDWMGKVMSVMGQSLASVYGHANLGVTYQVICGVQTSIFNPSAGTGSNPRLLSTQYISNNPGPPQSPYSNTAGVAEAWRWTSHVCCNHYIVPTNYNTAAETTLSGNVSLFTATIAGSTLTVAASPAPSGASIAVGQTILTVNGNITITALGTGTGGAGTYTINNPAGTVVSSNTAMSSLVMSYAATYIDTISTPGVSTNYATIEYLNTCYTNIGTWAAGLGVHKMAGYEGGYGQTYQHGGTAASNQVTALQYAAKLVSNSPNSATGLLKYTMMNYNNFVAAGGEFPSLLSFSGPTPSNNVWSVLEDVYQSPDQAQWTAIVLFNANKRRFRVTT